MMGVTYATAAEAITAWNTRAAIDINLDLMRQCVQSLLDDCQSVLNRQSIGVSYRHEWEGISLNAVRDIKQRAGVMLRLLDGEVVV